MDIIGTIETKDQPVELAARRLFANGETEMLAGLVQEESLLEVFVNDILTMELICSASNLVELVVGRLFTEGIIRTAGEIDALSVCEHSTQAFVYLKDRTADVSRKHAEQVPSCCTGNRVLNDFFGRDEELEAVEPRPWDAQAVFALAREFEADKTDHARTRGSHSAYLATLGGEVLAVGEDIGRHNAFDKVIGWAVINEVRLEDCMLYTSGRVPTDMVTKAIRARLPVLISKAVATDKTVLIARQYGLTLICSATSEHVDVLSE